MSALNISSFIWGIADDVLRDIYVRGKYRDVILPMTVIRRLGAVLEPAYWEVRRLRTVAKMRVSNVDKHPKEGANPVRLCNYVDV